MKREQSTAARSLRAVALVITLVTIVTFSTVAYSAYQDVEGVIGAGGGVGSIQPRIVGNAEVVQVNFTVPNRGLYPVRLQISCAPSAGLGVSCQPVDATVQPGLARQVSLLVSVGNLTQLQRAVSSGEAVHLQANLSVSLEPFATLSVGFDLGQAFTGGGA